MRESVPSGVLTSALRPAFIASSIVWALLLPLAPLAAARPHPSPALVALLYAVYLAGSAICHQLAERSFHLAGHQMPVCARCAGIYAGAAIAVITAAPLQRRSMTARRWRAILAAAAAPAVLSLLYEWTTGLMPSHWTRAATGVPLGAIVAWMVMSATAPRTRAEDQVN
jgi:uncharacterized membrane protein